MAVERKPGAEHEQLTIIKSPSQQMFWSRKATHSLLLVGGGGVGGDSTLHEETKQLL